MLGSTQDVGSCLATVIAGLVVAQVRTLIVKIINHSFGRLPCFVKKLQISRIGDAGGSAKVHSGERWRR